jgi:hypothetical protein
MHTGSQKESNTQTVSSLPDESVLENTEFSVEPIPHTPTCLKFSVSYCWLAAGWWDWGTLDSVIFLLAFSAWPSSSSFFKSWRPARVLHGIHQYEQAAFLCKQQNSLHLPSILMFKSICQYKKAATVHSYCMHLQHLNSGVIVIAMLNALVIGALSFIRKTPARRRGSE